MNDNLAQLASVLGMMGSQHDGEVLNAARLAERLRHKMNQSWGQLLASKSDNGSRNDDVVLWMSRALAAETRATALEGYVKLLRAEFDTLKAERTAWQQQQSRPSPGQDTSNDTSSLDLDVATEKRLSDALRSRALNASEIKVITKWVTRNMRPGLQRIANKRGLTLDIRSGLGGGVFYRFYNG